MVVVTIGLISTVEAPFNGVAHSYLGREGSWHGAAKFGEMKCLGLGCIRQRTRPAHF